MRVVFVINSLGAGGTERSTAQLLPHLRREGIDVQVLCLRHAAEGDEDVVRSEGIDVRIAPSPGWLPQLQWVRRMLRELRPDVVHTAIFEADVVGRLAAVGTGAAVVSSLISTPYEPIRFRDPAVNRLRLRAVQLVDALTGAIAVDRYHAVTEGVARAAARRQLIPRRRITVVERGRDDDQLGRVTPERRTAVRAALGIPLDAPVIVAVGRQVYAKDHAGLVDAFAVVASARPAARCVIVGPKGNATGALEAALRRSPVADHILVLGHRDDASDVVAAADVFAMPSRYEGTAGAAIEAMAVGVPVVAADVVGVEGVLTDEVNCLLVPPEDPRRLAAAILRMLTDAPLRSRLVARARSDFETGFDPTVNARRVAALYREVAPPERRDAGPMVERESRPPELDLSVIVCVRNGASTVGRQLDALSRQSWDGAWEVLIVDNDSTDATPIVAREKAAEDPRFRVVRAIEDHNLSYARNVGVTHARGRAVAFCDDDDVVGDGWVAAMGAALRSNAIVGSQMAYDEANEPHLLHGRHGFQSQQVEHFFGLPVVNGASGYQRDVWLRLGGNDPTLRFAGEDFDMALRAHLDLGLSPVLAEGAVYHCARRTGFRATFRQARRYGRSHVELYRRHARGRADRRLETKKALAAYAWLARNVAALLSDPTSRALWAWKAGLRLGRAQQSVASLTWLP